MIKNYQNLTKYPAGSFRELCTLALPLMMTALSTYAMIFGDRLILSKYSLEAMNAVGMVSVILNVFFFGFISLALIAEVFVGQYNGSKRYEMIGPSVWQLVWLSIFTTAIFWPVGFLLGDILIDPEFVKLGIPYFKICTLFGPLAPMVAALSSFFVGRGKILIVMLVVACGNILNIILDIFFVFGVEGYIPEMGTAGAALATGISLVAQALTLITIMLRPKYRQLYNTANYKLKKSLFIQCLRVGSPMAASHALAIMAWVVFYNIVSEHGDTYTTALVISQNYFFIANFVFDGMGKAICAICSNMIGAQRIDEISKVIISAIKMIFIYSAILAVPFVFHPEPIIDIFIKSNSKANIEGLYPIVKEALLWLWIFIFFNGFFWTFLNQLVAAGDTKYTMLMNVISAWCFFVFPTYLFIKVLGFSPDLAWQFMALDIFTVSILFYYRYWQGKWRKIKII